MKKSIALWSLTIPVLVFSIWKFQGEKSCVTHVERAHCASPFIPQMLAAAVVENPKPVNFQFSVGTRFGPINLSDVQAATHVNDFLPSCNIDQVVDYTKVTVSILDDYRITNQSVEGDSPQLNKAQRALLAKADYSDNILVRADFKQMNTETGETEDSYSSPYWTITPVQRAVYKDGNEALLAYFKDNCEDLLAHVRQNGLKSGKMYFTISEAGQLIDAYVSESCGYKEIDEKVVALSNQLPTSWLPAVTKDGKKVDQKLVLSFGMLGC